MEIKIGFDGIALVSSKNAPTVDLTLKQLFLAMARDVPIDEKLVPNPFRKWREIDKSLPDTEITVYGPPPTSGTRDAFAELVMEKGCAGFKEFETAYPKETDRKKHCQMLREDGGYVEAGENDNLVVQKVRSNPGSLGILGHSFYEENMDVVKASRIDGVDPTAENVSSGAYPVSRILYVYFKLAHRDFIPGLSEFAKFLVSEKSMGEGSYMIEEGLIPLPAFEREEQRKTAKESNPLKL